MRIAICDDDVFFRQVLKTIIMDYKISRRLHIDIFEYENGEALLASQRNFDIVFLDYQMPGPDGMAVARALRRRQLICSIVFVTSYPDFVYESFEVNPYRFWRKPITNSQIESLLNTYIAEQKRLAPLIVIDDFEQKVIAAKDILYLEGDGKYCIVRTQTETYHSSKTLAQVHALLPQHCFYRSHKSYVVNLYSIDSFKEGIVTLTNGECAKIGHSKTGEFKRIFKQFLKDYHVQT